MNVGGLTWEQAADALGCTTPAMAQWKTGKTGLSPKTLYRLEQKEAELGIRSGTPVVREEDAGEYLTRGSDAEMRRDLREMKKSLAAMDRKVDAMLRRIENDR